MRLSLLILGILFCAFTATSQESSSAPLPDLSEYLWTNRIILVFADSAKNPNFARQMELLGQDTDELKDRDVIVIADTSPKGFSALREKFRPRGFQIVLLGKDGNVKLRKSSPWTVREFSRTIDKMPLRREELRSKRKGNPGG